ncbi:MAG: membrane protein insertion efficiency factor YidD [Holosporales bacterium]|jgi:putative membrane protein insertion efficiency factor|nr:membrane protein insertion efficiency factor YidD [Holosporales bacterium]
MKIVNEFFIFLIRLYQIIFSFKKPCCRFYPTCSVYAIQAIRKYGASKGILLVIKRIMRCRPGIGKNKNFGYDPVP